MLQEWNGFYIYGAGFFGKVLADYFISKGKVPIAFLDRCPSESSYKNIPIQKFDKLSHGCDLPILISILGYPYLESELKLAGYNEIIKTFEVMSLFPEAVVALNQCGVTWMQAPPSVQYNESSYQNFLKLLCDEKSIFTLNKIFSYRMVPCVENYPHPETYEMYFSPDIPNLYAYESIKLLDVGAFDGDSLVGFYFRWPNKIDSYTGIEISQINIDSFWDRIRNFGIKFDNIKIIKGAVGVPLGSKLSLDENSSSTCVRLLSENEYCEQSQLVESYDLGLIASEMECNVLKMDIEGADYAALVQAIDYIRDFQPTLALSVYHHPEDLWRMAFAVEKAVPGRYNWYLRQEGHWGRETICYGVPKSLNN